MYKKLTYTGVNVELGQILYTVIHSISTLKRYTTETSIFLSKTKVCSPCSSVVAYIFKEHQCTQPLKTYFAVDMYASSRPSWNTSMNNYCFRVRMMWFMTCIAQEIPKSSAPLYTTRLGLTFF